MFKLSHLKQALRDYAVNSKGLWASGGFEVYEQSMYEGILDFSKAIVCILDYDLLSGGLGMLRGWSIRWYLDNNLNDIY